MSFTSAQLSNTNNAYGASGALSGSPLESVLQRITIIGEIVAFKDLLFRALHDILEQKIPFLLSSMDCLISTLDDLKKIVFFKPKKS